MILGSVLGIIAFQRENALEKDEKTGKREVCVTKTETAIQL
jgi:hypothetical protein